MRLRTTTPVFLVGDIASTLRWYRENLQFEGRGVPESPPHAFGIMRRDGVEIFLQQRAGYEPPDLYETRERGVWHVYVHMDGVREWFDTLSKRPDVTIRHGLTRQPYGQIEFEVKDPNGYVLVFAEQMRSIVDCDRQHPILPVADLRAATDFYEKKLGFFTAFTWGQPPTMAGVNLGHVQVFLEERPPAPGFGVYFVVDNADTLYEVQRAAGVHILQEPGNREYGFRDYTVRDLDGHSLTFGHRIGGA
jgi:catechol 2,3-dioxygenase-like lactoylglutathione lyase family enzyme